MQAPGVARLNLPFADEAPDTVTVARRSVVIGGPPGYCIDRGGSRLKGDTAFVLLGSCASILQDLGAGAPPVPALLTASVGAAGPQAPGTTAAALDQLALYFETPAGRATLARDGVADAVEIFSTSREGDALIIHLRDASETGNPGLDDVYWRALLDVNGRLVTISVVSFADRPLSGGEGLETIRAFVDRIRRETPATGAPARADVAENPRKNLFRTLFR